MIFRRVSIGRRILCHGESAAKEFRSPAVGRREPMTHFHQYERALLRFANETRVKGRAGESDIRRWPPVLHHPFVRAGAMAFVRCSRRAKFRLVEVALA
jgi:hypothetical protein